jgi:hypothetical protein
MHQELEKVFAEHDNPTHASKAAVHATGRLIGRGIADIRKQLVEYRTLVHEAETAPHDHALDGKLEQMHQTYGAIERDIAIMEQMNRNVTLRFTQLEVYKDSWKADVLAYEASTDASTQDADRETATAP